MQFTRSTLGLCRIHSQMGRRGKFYPLGLGCGEANTHPTCAPYSHVVGGGQRVGRGRHILLVVFGWWKENIRILFIFPQN